MGLSFHYDDTISDFVLGLDLQNNNMEAGVYGNVDNKRTTLGTEYTTWSVGGYLGLRKELHPLFFGAVGILGNYGFLSGQWRQAWRVTEPYNIGPYLAMEYQPQPYVQMFVRILPYSYGRNPINTRNNEVFQAGQIGMKYFWGSL